MSLLFLYVIKYSSFGHIILYIKQQKHRYMYNNVELQKIKTKMQEDKTKNNEKNYICIEAYKDTLNYRHENKLIKEIAKEEL